MPLFCSPLHFRSPQTSHTQSRPHELKEVLPKQKHSVSDDSEQRQVNDNELWPQHASPQPTDRPTERTKTERQAIDRQHNNIPTATATSTTTTTTTTTTTNDHNITTTTTTTTTNDHNITTTTTKDDEGRRRTTNDGEGRQTTTKDDKRRRRTTNDDEQRQTTTTTTVTEH